MTIIFEEKSAGKINARQELDGKLTPIGTFTATDSGEYEFKQSPKITLAEDAFEAIQEKFIAFLERRAATTPAEDEPATVNESLTVATTTPLRPESDPEQGTAGHEFMEWAGEHMPDAEFAELYTERWTKKHFRRHSEICPKFTARATATFAPDFQ